MGKKKAEEDTKAKVPGWMVSFGDMMTLILTFFILLVSMSTERQMGLVARGVGSFVAHLKSYGLNGVLDGQERAEVFNEVRARFNLPPEEDPERQVPAAEAMTSEVLDAKSIEQLEPRNEIQQPGVAIFGGITTELDGQARRYLDLIAPSLRPGPGQVLVLEGNARDSSAAELLLAQSRAAAVRQYLIDEHGLEPGRVEARTWLAAALRGETDSAAVDARLIMPSS